MNNSAILLAQLRLNPYLLIKCVFNCVFDSLEVYSNAECVIWVGMTLSQQPVRLENNYNVQGIEIDGLDRTFYRIYLTKLARSGKTVFRTIVALESVEKLSLRLVSLWSPRSAIKF